MTDPIAPQGNQPEREPEPEPQAGAPGVPAMGPEPEGSPPAWPQMDTPDAVPSEPRSDPAPPPVGPQMEAPDGNPSGPRFDSAATPVPTQAFGPPPVLPPPPRRRWRLRHTIIAALSAIVIAGVSVGVTFLARDPLAGAEERVLGYFGALSEEDGPAAGMFLRGIDGADSPVFEPDALSEGYRAPEDVRVTSSVEGTPPGVTEQDDRDYATVTVAYTVDGRPSSEMFVLSRKGDGNWNIVAARLGSIGFSDELVANDYGWEMESVMTVHVAGASGTGRVKVPPGVYEVSLKDDHLYEDFTIEVPVTAGTTGMQGDIENPFPPELTVSEAATEELSEQVNAAIDSCATTGNLPGDSYGSGSDCPWKSDDHFTDLFFLTEPWTVDSYPEIEVVQDEEGQLRVETVTPGKATYSDDTTTVELAPTGPVYRLESGSLTWESEDPNF
ncbi:hypothetical protein [Glycomyces buryatensis]|uniref:Uncharacterized protein n=1 Tax=Glycomyces buryatensis TaxID=2570927 RepID=A0A4S8QG90_9ACTN|nr:hypothetical protein [Glycomyces buryatensis]THV39674.1 hypothetical protein FAB82_16980 [Glycomyces buryatensis]